MREHRSTLSSKHRLKPPKIPASVVVFSFVTLFIGINVVLLARYFYCEDISGNSLGRLASKSYYSTGNWKTRGASTPVATASKEPVVVAHVVSLIKCSKQERVAGFLDAAAVLRHSIHKNSIHSGTSKYSYKMIAIVHDDCKNHAHALDRLGYQALVRPSPVKVEDIAEGYLKNHIEMENCCGSAEFIK